jgi:hypothetical protein
MRLQHFALVTFTAALSGCGGAWVDTSAGTCTDEQIQELRSDRAREMVQEMGSRTCQEQGKGAFIPDFRCTGSTENGTRRLQVKCSG